MNFIRLPQHPCRLDEATLLSQCRLHFTRRGGPGGQHRNKVDSAVVITHLPTQIIAEANERRDQSQNRRVAVARLRRQLAWLVRSEASSEVSPLWRTRCIEKSGDVSPEHWDYPTLIAEALDRIVECNWELSTAAGQLNVSTSRVAKLLRSDRQTLEWVNRQRATHNFPAIR
ncbi:MAG: peptide chain release factor-like protein [Planctomycetaceae bacterium]|nr:peptide chain release factor-like protein [Planctomycetaceae bacterium]